ncbi:MAG: T9SS type A sorting domain-containing protein [Bacteroidota bacterium]
MKQFIPAFLFVLLLNGFFLQKSNATSQVYYVDSSRTSGLNDGSNWANAFTSLQAALDVASTSAEIWVAVGTYKPTNEVGGIGSRFFAFQLKNNVAVYGGFAGVETQLSDRNIALNQTILSGDIGIVGDSSDNCFHVFNHPQGLHLDNSAVLDGFIIMGGFASGENPFSFGGGMYNDSNSPSIINCKFRNNFAIESGGAIYNMNSNPKIIGCYISNNNAQSADGGGIYNDGSNPIITNSGIALNYAHYSGGGVYNRNNSNPLITNCVIAGNKAIYGGGIFSQYSNPTVTNCTFSGDSAYQGGALYSTSNITINNSIFWGNNAWSLQGKQIFVDSLTTIINNSCFSNAANDVFVRQGAFTPTSCQNSYPGYVDPTHGDFRLVSGSPCKDLGNNIYNSELLDIRGNNRIQNIVIDMGAYEWTSGDTVEVMPVSGVLTKTPNTTNICEGASASAHFTPGSGGNNIDELRYRTFDGANWSAWINYTSETLIPTSGISIIEIRTRRLANFFYNSSYEVVSWNINPFPKNAGTITGLSIVCQGQNLVNYSVPEITNATSYIWTLPSGAIGTSTTNSISINYGVTAVSGDITVKGNNTCGNGGISTLTIAVDVLPSDAEAISGATTVCQGQNTVNYTVPVITNATSYIWTLPLGAIGTSTTNSISVDYGTSSISGEIKVKGNNTCGNGVESTLTIVVDPLPISAGIIIGDTSICQGQITEVYTVAEITGATSYIWTLPSGAVGTSSTNSISVNYSAAISGNITVKGHNLCGDGLLSTLSIGLYPTVTSAGTISGLTTVCQGQNSVTYTVPVISGATSYIWTLPSGATGTSTTNSITVNYGTTAISGNISVYGHNPCNDGSLSTVAIIVNPLPLNPGNISGKPIVCQGQNNVNFIVAPIPGASTYIWTLPSGAIGTSDTNRILVSFTNSAISGVITVRGHNDCGDGETSSLTVTVFPLPTAASTITGTPTVCQGQNAVLYSVPPITNAAYYIWTLPSGAIGISDTSSISVDFSATAVSGIITVNGHNSCGDGISSNFPITVDPLPANAGEISGIDTVCQGRNNVTYSVPVITDATSYIWTLPVGVTGTSTTNSITVDYLNTATSGEISVKGTNSCGDGVSSIILITVNLLLDTAETITGFTSVCQGQTNVIYSVPEIIGATSYIWTLPFGAPQTTTTNSITVNYPTTAISGEITVKGRNSCGDGISSSLNITINPLPISAGIITGNTTVCQGQSGVTYTVPEITNATSYVWTLPNGATGVSSTNSITVNYSTSAISGDITVTGHNSCGDGVSSSLVIIVNPLPALAGIISGDSTICPGQTEVIYTVPTIPNATSYIWTLPSGAIGASDSSSISVNYLTTAISGNITVKGHNSCGDGLSSIKNIIINPFPSNAGLISGNATVCQGQNIVTYTVPTITNSTSYIWTLPLGATGTSDSNSIVVNYGTSAISGNITVTGHNACGNGVNSSLPITVNPLPVDAGTIVGLTGVCQGQNLVTYSVPTITNATSYIWTLPSGATGASDSNSIVVNYGNLAISGNITVTGHNACGNGVVSTHSITVNPIYSFSENHSICQGDVYFWHGVDYSTANTYTANYTSVNGCDSNYTLILSINPTYEFTESHSICDGDYFPWQDSVYAVPNTYTVNYTTVNGCDSTYTLVLTANTVYEFTENHSICNGETYTWQGANYTTANTYAAYYVSSTGCDSNYTLVLTVNTVDVDVTLSGVTITANTAGDGYQWLDCNNSFTSIVGEMSQSYTATINGSYAVKITQGTCTDTSACIQIVDVGIAANSKKEISIYPNPVSNELYIDYEQNPTSINFEILNSIGQVVYKGSLGKRAIIQTTNFAPGVYIIKMDNGLPFQFNKIIKQ